MAAASHMAGSVQGGTERGLVGGTAPMLPSVFGLEMGPGVQAPASPQQQESFLDRLHSPSLQQLEPQSGGQQSYGDAPLTSATPLISLQSAPGMSVIPGMPLSSMPQHMPSDGRTQLLTAPPHAHSELSRGLMVSASGGGAMGGRIAHQYTGYPTMSNDALITVASQLMDARQQHIQQGQQAQQASQYNKGAASSAGRRGTANKRSKTRQATETEVLRAVAASSQAHATPAHQAQHQQKKTHGLAQIRPSLQQALGFPPDGSATLASATPALAPPLSQHTRQNYQAQHHQHQLQEPRQEQGHRQPAPAHDYQKIKSTVLAIRQCGGKPVIPFLPSLTCPEIEAPPPLDEGEGVSLSDDGKDERSCNSGQPAEGTGARGSSATVEEGLDMKRLLRGTPSEGAQAKDRLADSVALGFAEEVLLSQAEGGRLPSPVQPRRQGRRKKALRCMQPSVASRVRDRDSLRMQAETAQATERASYEKWRQAAPSSGSPLATCQCLPWGFSPQLVPRAASVYAAIRSLSLHCRLKPFAAFSFFRGLALRSRTPLIDEIHVALLQAVVSEGTWDGFEEKFLDCVTWPAFLGQLSARKEGGGAGGGARDLLSGSLCKLGALDGRHAKLPVADKLVILEFLLSCIGSSARLQARLNRASSGAATLADAPSSGASAICCLCETETEGQMLHCSACQRAYHLSCVGSEMAPKKAGDAFECLECHRRLRDPSLGKGFIPLSRVPGSDEEVFVINGFVLRKLQPGAANKFGARTRTPLGLASFCPHLSGGDAKEVVLDLELMIPDELRVLGERVGKEGASLMPWCLIRFAGASLESSAIHGLESESRVDSEASLEGDERSSAMALNLQLCCSVSPRYPCSLPQPVQTIAPDLWKPYRPGPLGPSLPADPCEPPLKLESEVELLVTDLRPAMELCLHLESRLQSFMTGVKWHLSLDDFSLRVKQTKSPRELAALVVFLAENVHWRAMCPGWSIPQGKDVENAAASSCADPASAPAECANVAIAGVQPSEQTSQEVVSGEGKHQLPSGYVHPAYVIERETGSLADRNELDSEAGVCYVFGRLLEPAGRQMYVPPRMLRKMARMGGVKPFKPLGYHLSPENESAPLSFQLEWMRLVSSCDCPSELGCHLRAFESCVDVEEAETRAEQQNVITSSRWSAEASSMEYGVQPRAAMGKSTPPLWMAEADVPLPLLGDWLKKQALAHVRARVESQKQRRGEVAEMESLLLKPPSGQKRLRQLQEEFYACLMRHRDSLEQLLDQAVASQSSVDAQALDKHRKELLVLLCHNIWRQNLCSITPQQASQLSWDTAKGDVLAAALRPAMEIEKKCHVGYAQRLTDLWAHVRLQVAQKGVVNSSGGGGGTIGAPDSLPTSTTAASHNFSVTGPPISKPSSGPYSQAALSSAEPVAAPAVGAAPHSGQAQAQAQQVPGIVPPRLAVSMKPSSHFMPSPAAATMAANGRAKYTAYQSLLARNLSQMYLGMSKALQEDDEHGVSIISDQVFKVMSEFTRVQSFLYPKLAGMPLTQMPQPAAMALQPQQLSVPFQQQPSLSQQLLLTTQPKHRQKHVLPGAKKTRSSPDARKELALQQQEEECRQHLQSVVARIYQVQTQAPSSAFMEPTEYAQQKESHSSNLQQLYQVMRHYERRLAVLSNRQGQIKQPVNGAQAAPAPTQQEQHAPGAWPPAVRQMGVGAREARISGAPQPTPSPSAPPQQLPAAVVPPNRTVPGGGNDVLTSGPQAVDGLEVPSDEFEFNLLDIGLDDEWGAEINFVAEALRPQEGPAVRRGANTNREVPADDSAELGTAQGNGKGVKNKRGGGRAAANEVGQADTGQASRAKRAKGKRVAKKGPAVALSTAMNQQSQVPSLPCICGGVVIPFQDSAIQCSSCSKFVHALCVGLPSDPRQHPVHFTCPTCVGGIPPNGMVQHLPDGPDKLESLIDQWGLPLTDIRTRIHCNRQWLLKESSPAPGEPYTPQKGDLVCYFPAGHSAAIQQVADPRSSLLPSMGLDWIENPHNAPSCVQCRVESLSYIFPAAGDNSVPCVYASLKLAPLVPEGQPKLRPFPLVLRPPFGYDFIVLRNRVANGAHQQWQVGDQAQWFSNNGTVHSGKIVRVHPNAATMWKGVLLQWEATGTQCIVNAWELMKPNENAAPAFEPGQLKADGQFKLAHVLLRWIQQQGRLIEPFHKAPKEWQGHSYISQVPVPMDLSKIVARLQAGFYRWPAAVHADLELISSNCHLYDGCPAEMQQRARDMYQSALKVCRACMQDSDG